MFTIVNMSKATLCNSLERVTEAVPKVQYSGQYHWVQTKTDPVSVTTSVPTQSPQQPPPPRGSIICQNSSPETRD